MNEKVCKFERKSASITQFPFKSSTNFEIQFTKDKIKISAPQRRDFAVDCIIVYMEYDFAL